MSDLQCRKESQELNRNCHYRVSCLNGACHDRRNYFIAFMVAFLHLEIKLCGKHHRSLQSADFREYRQHTSILGEMWQVYCHTKVYTQRRQRKYLNYPQKSKQYNFISTEMAAKKSWLLGGLTNQALELPSLLCIM